MSDQSTNATNVDDVLRAAKSRFALELHGLHGMRHWQRVRYNGLTVAEQSGADKLIVELFAYLHDCCREHDGTDRGHGQRAADFAASLRGSLIHLSAPDFALLYEAIQHHEKGRTRSDVTVMSCWDADRLDLGRVGMRPDPAYLCTEFAKRKSTIERAYKRSISA